MDAMIFSTGKFIGFDNSGQIIPYGNVYFTDTVSGLPITTYQDSAMTAENPYPVVLSASGKADIFLKDANYDITLKDKNFATVWTINNFVPPIGSSSLNDAIDTLKKDEITYPIDTINDLRNLTMPYRKVWVSGYHTKGDGAFGSHIFEWDDTSTEADNGGTIIKLNGVPIGRYKLKYNGAVNVKWFDAVGDGVTDDTLAINNAYINSSSLYIPEGIYLGNFVFNDRKVVKGESKDSTILMPKLNTSPCVDMTTANNITNKMSLRDLTITGETTNTSGVGLLIGGASGNDSIMNNVTISNIDIRYFDINFQVNSSLGMIFSNITSEYGVSSAIYFAQEKANTTNTFINCRFRQSGVGIDLRALMSASFIGCTIEANKDIGLSVIGSTTNTSSKIIFQTCWFEANGNAPTGNNTGIESGIYLDFNSTVGATYSHDIDFNNCVISSPNTSIPNVYVQRAMNVNFYKCAFTKLDTDYLYYNSGVGITQVYLTQCSEWKLPPTEAMYTNFPALSGVEPNFIGFKYKFKDHNGIEFTNDYKQVGVLNMTDTDSPTDIDVLGIEVILCDTTNGNVTLRNFAQGKVRIGQRINVVNTTGGSSYNVILFHSADARGITSSTGANVNVIAKNSVTIIYDGIAFHPQV